MNGCKIRLNRYEKEVLLQKESITSAIFLLDQKIEYGEYINRIATSVKAFNKPVNITITIEEMKEEAELRGKIEGKYMEGRYGFYRGEF